MTRQVRDVWELVLTPLSPVHMGTGRDYEPTDYVIDGETLYALNSAEMGKALLPAERKRLEAVTNGPPSVAMLRSVQGLFFEARERLSARAADAMPVAPGLAALYQARVGQTAQKESTGREIINRMAIERCAREGGGGDAIIPGSGLKGAIRTALLNALNDGTGRRSDAMGRDAHRQLEQDLLGYQAGRFEQDPLRLLNVTDACPVDRGAPHTEIRFAVNRHKRARKAAADRTGPEPRGAYQLLETLMPMRLRAFEATLATQDVPPEAAVREDWVPRADRRFPASEIAQACHSFYGRLFEAELEQLRSRGFLSSDWAAAQARLLEVVQSRLDSGRAFLLRVGRHSGAESVTIEGARSIKIMAGKGKEPRHLSEATTWWLAAGDHDDQRHLVPFGWVLAEMRRPGEALPELSGVGEAVGPYQRPLVEWIKNEHRRREELQLRRRQADRLRREAEARAEAEQHAQREREARMASLSAEERKLEELATWYEEDRAAGRADAGGRLTNRLGELIAESADWPQDSRTALADLGERIYGLVGWGKGKKKQEKKARLAGLRGEGGSE